MSLDSLRHLKAQIFAAPGHAARIATVPDLRGEELSADATVDEAVARLEEGEANELP